MNDKLIDFEVLQSCGEKPLTEEVFETKLSSLDLWGTVGSSTALGSFEKEVLSVLKESQTEVSKKRLEAEALLAHKEGAIQVNQLKTTLTSTHYALDKLLSEKQALSTTLSKLKQDKKALDINLATPLDTQRDNFSDIAQIEPDQYINSLDDEQLSSDLLYVKLYQNITNIHWKLNRDQTKHGSEYFLTDSSGRYKKAARYAISAKDVSNGGISAKEQLWCRLKTFSYPQNTF